MRQAFLIGLALAIGYYAGHSFKRQPEVITSCVSPRALQGCEETAMDMLQSSMNCEYEKESCETRWRACNESLNNLNSGENLK